MIKMSSTIIFSLLLLLSLPTFAKENSNIDAKAQTKLERELGNSLNLLGENADNLDGAKVTTKIDSLKLEQNQRVNDSARSVKKL